MHVSHLCQVKYNEAESLIARALEIGIRVLDSSHPTMVAILGEQEALLRAQVSALEAARPSCTWNLRRTIAALLTV